MARPKELTDRDLGLLSVLSECRVLEMDRVGLLYETQDYHRARVRVLAKRGYVLKRGRYVQIAQKGLRQVCPGETVIPVRNDRQRRHLSEIANLHFMLSNWSFTYSATYKRKVQSIAFARFGAVIEREDQKYAVYLLLTKPRDASIRKLRQEIAGLPRHGLDCAVVFYVYDQTPEYFQDDPLGLKSLLLLSYPDGVEILQNLDQHHARVQAGYKGCVPCDRPFADYRYKNGYISVLVKNDLAKIKYLRDYLKHVQPVEKRPCVGVCLPHQKQDLVKTLPNLVIHTLPEKKVV